VPAAIFFIFSLLLEEKNFLYGILNTFFFYQPILISAQTYPSKKSTLKSAVGLNDGGRD
jgi:hypothetical protein